MWVRAFSTTRCLFAWAAGCCRQMAFAIMLAYLGSAVAQEATLEPMVVTATRIQIPTFEAPASIDLVSGADIRDARLQVNLAESLGGVPGLTVHDRENYAQDQQISIRGFGAHTSFGVVGVRVYVDGIPATLPDGQGQITNIDLGSVERIEILRGPASALYGNSSGGVIQIFTETGAGAPSLTTSLAGGSYGEVREGLKAQGAAGPLDYVIDADHFQTAGYRDHSAAVRNIVNAKITYAIDPDSRMTLILNSVDQPEAQDPLGQTRAEYTADPRAVDPAALEFNTRKTVDQSQGGLIYERRIDDADSLRVLLYQGERNIEQFQAIPLATEANVLSPGGVIALARSYDGTDVRWTRQSSVGGTPYTLVGGVSYDALRENRLGFNNFSQGLLGVEGLLRRAQSNDVANFDQYLQGSLEFSDAWGATLGMRHSLISFDSVDDHVLANEPSGSGRTRYEATLPVAELLYAPSADWRFHASAGRGFETPTLDELAYRPNGLPGLNFSLQPATSDNYELGAKSRNTLIGEANAAVFLINTANEIVTQTNSGGRSTFQNAGTTRRTGLELGATQKLDSNWRTEEAYTYLDAYYRQSFLTCANVPCSAPHQLVPAGNRLPGTARSTLFGSLAWMPPLGWQAGVEARFLSQVYANDANTGRAAGYAIASAHVAYVVQLASVSLSTFLRVDNMFNRNYIGSVIVDETSSRFYEAAPGRSFLAGITATFQ